MELEVRLTAAHEFLRTRYILTHWGSQETFPARHFMGCLLWDRPLNTCSVSFHISLCQTESMSCVMWGGPKPSLT